MSTDRRHSTGAPPRRRVRLSNSLHPVLNEYDLLRSAHSSVRTSRNLAAGHSFTRLFFLLGSDSHCSLVCQHRLSRGKFPFRVGTLGASGRGTARIRGTGRRWRDWSVSKVNGLLAEITARKRRQKYHMICRLRILCGRIASTTVAPYLLDRLIASPQFCGSPLRSPAVLLDFFRVSYPRIWDLGRWQRPSSQSFPEPSALPCIQVFHVSSLAP